MLESDPAELDLEYAVPIRFTSIEGTDELEKRKRGTRAYGWGLTEAGNNSSVSNKLQEVDLKLDSFIFCSSTFAITITITSNMICAGGSGFFDSDKDTCQGDSGGPLVYLGESEPVLVGLTSFGPTICATENVSGVYTRVSEYLDWINDLELLEEDLELVDIPIQERPVSNASGGSSSNIVSTSSVSSRTANGALDIFWLSVLGLALLGTVHRRHFAGRAAR